MTIFDGKRSLSFNVIDYEDEYENDPLDWLIFKFTYSDGDFLAEYYDPSLNADELIGLINEMQKIIRGEETVLIADLLDNPAFKMVVIESNGEYAVAVYAEKYEDGKRIHSYKIREVMPRNRFEEFIAEMTAEAEIFPCRH